ncbi:MAG TPA: hypothetical protein ENH84_07620 [Phycisphaerae bacterium]|nr:hypothetical protein [Phycisphaerae bacterium]
MKTLDEHNTERQRELHRAELPNPHPLPNGIACPTCSEELRDSNPSMTLTSDPPQKNIHCDNCGYRGYRLA